MALSMPSRFAVLKIEDDDFRPQNTNKAKDKKKNDQKQNSKKVEKPGSSASSKKSTKQQQPSKPSQKKDKKKKEVVEQQWEEWKQKDSELVDGNFEDDLHAAILESKLDYEEKKDLYKLHKKQADQEKKATETQIKKKKSKVMSLGQFNTLVSTNTDASQVKEDDYNGSQHEDDDQFFEKIQFEAKVQLTKELTKKQSKESKETKKDRKSFNNDTITIAHLQEKLEALKSENNQLKSNLEIAKKEIITVKSRNKILCGMLASGEMKDKADILLEVEKLNRVRDELSEEVTRLHGLLEQERSKVGVLTAGAEPHPHNHSHKHKEKTQNRKKGKE